MNKLPNEILLYIIFFCLDDIKKYKTLSLISKKFNELSKDRYILRIIFNMLNGLNEESYILNKFLEKINIELYEWMNLSANYYKKIWYKNIYIIFERKRIILYNETNKNIELYDFKRNIKPRIILNKKCFSHICIDKLSKIRRQYKLNILIDPKKHKKFFNSINRKIKKYIK